MYKAPSSLHILRSCFVFLFTLATLLPAQPAFAQTTRIIDQAGSQRDRITVTLTADQAPSTGGVATLIFDATPLLAAPDLTIHWTLPNGGELLGDATESMGAVAAGQTVRSMRQVRFPTEGVFKVAVAAVYQPNPAAQFSAAGVLFFTVRNGAGSTASDRDPNAVSPMRSTMETSVEAQVGAAGVDATTDDPCFDVSGQITRIERTPTQTGYAPDIRVPVRFARVEMREEDILFDDSYDETETDANGNYSFSFCDDDGLFDDELELYITLHARIYSGGQYVVMVEDSSFIDEVYEFKSITLKDSPGGSYTINMTLNEMQSSVFNIADAVYDAWNFWNNSGGAKGDDAIFDYTAEVHWEPGYGDDGSYYNGDSWDEITIADDPSDPDEWDDSVIMHEWGHMADDKYGCDDNAGGEHFVFQTVDDPELSWGEGYPDYYQSAVRSAIGATDGNFYIDINGVDTPGLGIRINLETWDTMNPTLVDELSEFAIAAMLWDFNDFASDGQDTVAHGHALVQEVYTDPAFESNGSIFDDTCTAPVYLRSWRELKKPTDAATAATVTQNIGLSNPFDTQLVAADNASAWALTDELTTFGSSKLKTPDYKWWQQLTLIADRSASMAGTKFSAVKNVMTEQVNDLASEPKGVEFSLYTFDNTSVVNQNLLKGKFFANLVTPSINSLTTNAAADPNCPVRALGAMAQTLAGKKGGHAWLFTDGDTLQQPDVETVVEALNQHQVKGSFALLGGCSSPPDSPVNVSGGMKNYLGLAANATQPGGVVPYLLTAIGSGGQFLFVDQNQLADAAAILRAQLTHSAGAGRWSDYVSNQPTYLYDRLTSWEFNWIDTSQAAGGTYHGVPSSAIEVPLPQPFSFFSTGAHTNAFVYRYGYLTLGTSSGGVSSNTTLPNPLAPNNALYPLWDDINWNEPPAVVAAATDAANAPNAVAATLQAYVFSKAEGDWFAIETNGQRFSGGTLAYQVLLNATTGEIRFQYKNITNDAQGATIGIENAAGNHAVQVSYNDASAAGNNMGYKFVPAPAQPSKTYTVPVDSLMSGVGFLVTGYSGSLAPLDVRYPDGAAVSCADTANVLCLNLGLVQYVQANVNGRSGVWKATVSAGPGGNGTFSFSSMAASALSAQSSTSRSLSLGSQPFHLKLGAPVSGNLLDGWLQQPNGAPFGLNFKLYDDGAHGDGAAGDGEFGSDAFTPPGAGVAYLWVKGNANGVDFVRSDPAPFNFQPLAVTSLGDGVNLGDVTHLHFTVTNQDTVAHCYDRTTQVPTGWLFDWNLTAPEINFGLCLDAGATVTKTLDVQMASVSPNTLPSGASGEVVVTFVEREEGKISDSASARVTRYRPPASLQFNEESASFVLRPNGTDQAPLRVLVLDEQGVSVADGTPISFTVSLGSVAPAALALPGAIDQVTALTDGGLVDVTFTAGTTPGDALVTALANGLVATTTIRIQTPLPDAIGLTATPNQLGAGDTNATLLATVRDKYGDPVSGQTVRIGVTQDGQMGLIDGSEVMTGTTNALGQLSATFTRVPTATGTVAVRAELLALESGGSHVALHASTTITLTAAPKQDQTITFPALADKRLGDPPFAVTATASSNLPVSFASNTPTVCTVSGNQVTLLGTGVCTLVATQPGNEAFNPAAAVTQSFTVLPNDGSQQPPLYLPLISR